LFLAANNNGTPPVVDIREQTNPPSIPISELFPDGNYPEGEILEHPKAIDG
jgi:hypothetical protein